MVQQVVLDRVFSALADATRRQMPVRPGDGPASIGERAEPFGMSSTGMKEHIVVLENAGLVTSEKIGRSRRCRLGTERMDDAMSWIVFHQCLWERRLDGLDAYFTLRKGTEE